MFLYKTDDWAVSSATAIEGNEADEHLDQKKLRYLIARVIL